MSTTPEPNHTATGRQPPFPDEPTLLEEFGAVIAHELATPLAIIKTAADLALQHGPDTPADEHRSILAMIQRNTQLAELLLRRLGLARDVEAGEVALSCSRIDLGELVEESVGDLRQVILADHPVSVSIDEAPVIVADPTAAREIVFNLLSNAAKYSDVDAAIDVNVGVDGPDAHVVVRNHGTGVTPGDSDRIFEKFERGRTDAPGAGLGLFISRGLARAHGGDLTVQAAERIGSEFRLTLPLGA